MLGDAADYSEFKNGRRATGLIYSAGSFATKFGGGIAGAIIGLVLGFSLQRTRRSRNSRSNTRNYYAYELGTGNYCYNCCSLNDILSINQNKIDEITLELQVQKAQ